MNTNDLLKHTAKGVWISLKGDSFLWLCLLYLLL